MSEEFVYINGEFVPRSEARISVFDSGLMRGDTITESIRTFRHVPYRLDEHVKRLFKSLNAARYSVHLTPQQITQITMDVVKRNLPFYDTQDDFWIVLNITRGPTDLSNDPSKTKAVPTVIIFTARLDLTYWAKFYADGCHAVTPFSRAIPAQCLDPKIKNRSRLAYTLCDLEVKLVDPAAQCLLLDIDGNLSENKGGNFCLVTDGVVATPTLRNALAGESRQTIAELCRELRTPFVERDLQPYDVASADEAFFTSTPYCMMPATRFNGLPIGDGRVGPITKRLLEAWSQRVGLDIVAQATSQFQEH